MVLRQSSLSIWFWDPPQKQKSLDSQVPKIKWYRSSIYNQSTLDPTLGIHLHIRIPQTRKANCIFKVMQHNHCLNSGMFSPASLKSIKL